MLEVDDDSPVREWARPLLLVVVGGKVILTPAEREELAAVSADLDGQADVALARADERGQRVASFVGWAGHFAVALVVHGRIAARLEPPTFVRGQLVEFAREWLPKESRGEAGLPQPGAV